jgi:hypothetical protein
MSKYIGRVEPLLQVAETGKAGAIDGREVLVAMGKVDVATRDVESAST